MTYGQPFAFKPQDSLREEARRRTTVDIGIAHPARVEPDPAVVEAEVRRVVEKTISVRTELVTNAVDPEIVVMLETFGMRENHAPDFECAESELVGHEDLASPTDAATPVTETELGSDDQDVEALLLVTQRLELFGRTLVLAKILFPDPVFAVVVEFALALLLDQIEHLLHRLVVGLSDQLPPGNGEPSFGIGRKQLIGQLLIGESDAREELPQDVGLLRDPLDLVTIGVHAVGLDFLVGELVGHGVLQAFRPAF